MTEFTIEFCFLNALESMLNMTDVEPRSTNTTATTISASTSGPSPARRSGSAVKRACDQCKYRKIRYVSFATDGARRRLFALFSCCDSRHLKKPPYVADWCAV